MDSALDNYILKGGLEGSARLRILAEALAPSTAELLDRVSPLAGKTIVDAACGGGDVTLELAARAGPRGSVTGFDLDPTILMAASDFAKERGASNVRFQTADVTMPWPVTHVDLVYARFILTHLPIPEQMLERAMAALVPGGHIVIEDIDAEGRFIDPPCAAIERIFDLYSAVSTSRCGHPTIGRRLGRMLDTAGFKDVQTAMVQPYGATGPAKKSVALVLPAIAHTAIAAKLATASELKELDAEVNAFAARPDTVISMPRIFQAWAVKA
jgi:ubiquinone/menaquinone biosynthesis C-methylase UbiE